LEEKLNTLEQVYKWVMDLFKSLGRLRYSALMERKPDKSILWKRHTSRRASTAAQIVLARTDGYGEGAVVPRYGNKEPFGLTACWPSSNFFGSINRISTMDSNHVINNVLSLRNSLKAFI
jgi:hypothetical protein